MNAQLILNRHPRAMRTVYWLAVDSRRNLFDVAAEYGFTREQTRAFLDDFNAHDVDVPRPAGWQSPNTNIVAASSSYGIIGQSAQDPNTPSLIELRVAELERRVAELERG